MKNKANRIIFLRRLATCFFGLALIGRQPSFAQKNAGIFYSTIFAKTGPYSRIKQFGQHADAYFMKDVNGDGKDDAVAWFSSRPCQVALSDGTNFTDPSDFVTNRATSAGEVPLMGDLNGDGKADLVIFNPVAGNWEAALSNGTRCSAASIWATGAGVGSTQQFLADVNGDNKDDAVIFFRTGQAGCWYVGLSTGQGFRSFSRWITGFGESADQCLTGDVNGDGRADLLQYSKDGGRWEVALSDGTRFIPKGTWKTGFGIHASLGLVADIDKDNKADIVSYKEGVWQVSYSTGDHFEGDHRWIMGNRPATMVSRGHKPAPEANLLGNISGNGMGACAVSDGEWLYLENANKQATVDAAQVDTWTAWGNQYIPRVGGISGTYDAGDPQVVDKQIKMIHDAGFTYIMLDITNGINPWVDDRAKKLIGRIIFWNQHLDGQTHKMFFCIAMGSSRGLEADAATKRCEEESKRSWTEFYLPYKDAYYLQDGKPFMVHFVEHPPNRDHLLSQENAMPYFRKFTVRWMYNDVKNEATYRNSYGWPLLYKGANPVGDEVMDVSPGFWNGVGNLPNIGREQGAFYQSLWVRVLKFDPKSVWLNSFNETWEHTSVEPSYLPEQVARDFPGILSTWTDYSGQRMDDFYWIMTQQYNRLYMYKELFIGSYLQEQSGNEIYQAGAQSIHLVGTKKPSGSPVLLVPDGFIRQFEGKVIDHELHTVGTITHPKKP